MVSYVNFHMSLFSRFFTCVIVFLCFLRTLSFFFFFFFFLNNGGNILHFSSIKKKKKIRVVRHIGSNFLVVCSSVTTLDIYSFMPVSNVNPKFCVVNRFVCLYICLTTLLFFLFLFAVLCIQYLDHLSTKCWWTATTLG